MKKITSVSYAIFSIVALCSWAAFSEKPIKKAQWLIGTWENKTSKGSVYETWSKVSDDEFFEKSYMLKGKDTILFESVRLVQEQNSLFYIPTVKGQNNGLPVRFSLKSITDTNFVFENPTHDFPQLISYTKIGTDSLVAETSGIKNGQQRKQTFPMKRIK